MPCIYKIQNKQNGKIYIGQTKMTLEQRLYSNWKGHFKEVESGSQCYIHNAIRKYGKDGFTYEVIEEKDTTEFKDKKELQLWLNEREKYWIAYYKSDCHNFGYNKTKGGQYKVNPDFTEFAKRRGLESAKRWQNPEYRKKAIANMKIANARKTKEEKHNSAMLGVETRRKNGTLKPSEASKIKIKSTLKKLWQDNDYRQRQSESKKGNTNVKGRIHVYKKNEDYRMIKLEQLEEFLANGYTEGTGRSHHHYLTEEEKQLRRQRMIERGTLDKLRDMSKATAANKGSKILYKNGVKKFFKKEEIQDAKNTGWMTYNEDLEKNLGVELHKPKFALLYKDGKQKRIKPEDYEKALAEGWLPYKEYLASGGKLSWRFPKRGKRNENKENK